MEIPIVIFYHAYLFSGNPPELKPNCFNVVAENMRRLSESGLANFATEIICGINGGQESLDVARLLVPKKAKIVLHGLESKNENATVVLSEQWVRDNPGEAHILYFHAKSSSHDPQSEYGKFDRRWAECMMHHCIDNWPQCIRDLGNYQAVGCHWMTGQGWDKSQSYFAGTFYWVRASFLRTIPSMFERERIKISGLGSPESKYEAEITLGNGPRLPTVRDYHPGGFAH